ncbi:MAG: 16S rRNA (guanine(966)-N(2))-methyltransferase RsmD [Pseudomonadales bacterium]
MANEVRIIGGNFRGRKLVFPDLPDLRPTLGRVRETVFNWLRADVADSRCLDLFAGSGALGFEALSRGAATVTFVDSSRRVIRCLRDNADKLAVADRVELVCGRAEAVLRRGAGPWDIVFLDPPFRADALIRTLDALADCAALAEGGLVYVEAPRRDALPSGRWRALKEATAGDTRFGLLATP